MVSPSKGSFHPELEGGKGREVLFRPPRFNMKELIGEQSMFVFFDDFDGTTVSYEILNLSANGLAFAAPLKEVLRNGERLRNFEIRWGHDIVYAGQASVTNQREQDGQLIVGISLKSGALDTETINGLREKARVREELKSFYESFNPLFESDIKPAFKALIADMRLLMERHQRILNELEHSYKGLSKHRESWGRDVLSGVEPNFTSKFHGLVEQLFECIRDLPREARTPYRNYTQYHLHDLVMESLVFRRAYDKPLGYAGDYQVLLWIYNEENHYEGDTLFGKLMQRSGCTAKAGLAGIHRIPYLTDKIRTRLNQHTSFDALRLFSLASGPAKEIHDFLASEEPPSQPIEVTLFDQDEEALTYCHDVLTPLVEKQQDNVQVNYLHSSVKQIIKDQDFVASLPKQDMITSTGLFDYLPTHVAARLLSNLVSMLKPGGVAIIGNFKVSDTQFIFEYLCDWDLIYRTEEDLRALAATIQEPVDVAIECEETGYNLFLVVTKKE
ncbi:MAG: class I SAM-dependent methyltransferase [Deltaproteobacteria bacterium]|nr:MAG: class I SAM-dependent methyltransferase [Deltaproteobacteria bacterium]